MAWTASCSCWDLMKVKSAPESLRAFISAYELFRAYTVAARYGLIAVGAVAWMAGYMVAYRVVAFAQRCIDGSKASVHNDMATAPHQRCQLGQKPIHCIEFAFCTQNL